MIILLVLAAALFVAIRFSSRLAALESAVDTISARLEQLEQADRRRAAAEPARPPQTAAPTPPAIVQPPVVPVRPPAHAAKPVAPAVPPPVPSAVDAPAPAVHRPAPIMTDETPRTSGHAGLETRIGSRWLLYVGVVAILVGVSYFEKLALDNRWIGETTRIVQGGIAGLFLIAGGLLFVRKGYRLYGQILSGCGVAILYVSTYAAFNFYHLITQATAFGLMSAVTAAAAWLANRQRSQGLALVAVGGGFATPFLLPSSAPNDVALLGYDAFLIAGTMYLARRRDWPTLNVVSYGFTVVTFFAWAFTFYRPSKYLVAELFLTLFCGMFLFILAGIRHSHHPLAKAQRAILWTAPIGYYVLSLAILGPHNAALLVFLVLLSLAGVIAGSRSRSWVRLLFWSLVATPLLLWSDGHGGRVWLAPGLVTWTAVYLLNLAGLLGGTLEKDRTLTAPDIALLHANPVSAYLGAYLLLTVAHPTAAAPLAAGVAVLHGVGSLAIRRRHREEGLHFAALAFTFLTIAMGLEFDGPWITAGWAAEGAVVTYLGLREQRGWLRAAGLLLFVVSIARLVSLQFAAPPVGQMVLANPRAFCGLFVILLTYGLTWAHRRHGAPATVEVETGIGLVVVKLLALGLAAGEINAYWMLHPAPPFEPDAQLVDASFVTGFVVMWLGLRRRQEWIRAIGGAVLFLAAFSLLSIQLEPAPPGYVSVLNARAAAGLLGIATLYGLVVLHRQTGRHLVQLPVNIAVLTTSASLLTLSLLTSEIDAFWAARGATDVWSIAREGLHAIAWGATGGFLIWLGITNRRWWIRGIGGSLLVVAVLRLLRLQFASAAPDYVAVANARVVASIVVIALLYGLASLYRRVDDLPESQHAPSAMLWLAANALTLTLFTSEITAYWHVRDLTHTASLASPDSHFAREMMLSITWAVYATILIVVGLRKGYAPIRYFAMTVFVMTIVKVFAIDLAELDRIYRVLSVIGLGVTLLLTSYLYQRLSVEMDQR